MLKAYEVNYLSADQIEFTRHGDTLGLTVTTDGVGVHYPRVILRSCFPVSDNVTFLSIRDANTERQTEIGIVEDWTKLRPADRDAVAAEMALFYLVPKITRINAIKEELGFLYWTVETDKGPQEFVMRNDITHYTRQISDYHWLIIDVNEARHEIADISGLDPRSQKLLERFLSV